MDYLSIVLSAILQFSNPLEQLDVDSINIPNIEIEIIESSYSVNNDFKVNEITKSNGHYVISFIVNDSIEIVIPGIDEINVHENIEYAAGTLIGKDYSINSFTKYVLFLYSEKIEYCQIENNKLNLIDDRGSPVFSSCSGVVEETGYDVDRGIYFEFIPDDRFVGKIEYWYLGSLALMVGEKINSKSERIASVGNTGLTISPKLGITFKPAKYYEEYKIIYLRTLLSG